tara:strand:- start:20928 stop:21893 length:966 start_codon:yes stop_codon:yes gene_type:complete
LKKYLKNIIRTNLDKYYHLKNYYFLNENNYLVLLYHRVQNKHIVDPTYNYILTEEFYNQIRYINKNYDIVSVNDIFKKNKTSKPKILITFDDAYKDNYTNAFPILKEFNLSSLFFLPTYFIDNKKVLWDRHICLLLIYANDTKKKIEIFDSNNKLIFFKHQNQKLNNKNFWDIINYFKKTNINLINSTIKNLSNDLNFPINLLNTEYCFSEEDIRIMSKHNIYFGSHSHFHLSLKDKSHHEVVNELILSSNIIKNITKKKCNYFAFPFGSFNDFSFSQIDYLSPNIFDKIFLNIKGLSTIDEKFAKRIIMHSNKNCKYIMG